MAGANVFAPILLLDSDDDDGDDVPSQDTATPRPIRTQSSDFRNANAQDLEDDDDDDASGGINAGTDGDGARFDPAHAVAEGTGKDDVDEDNLLMAEEETESNAARAVSDNSGTPSTPTALSETSDNVAPLSSSRSCDGDDCAGDSSGDNNNDSDDDSGDNAADEEIIINEGFRICKRFDDNKYYTGKVISVEEACRRKNNLNELKQPFRRSPGKGPDEWCWYVGYDDGDAEEMSERELRALAIPLMSQQPKVSDDPPAYYLLEETNNTQTKSSRKKRKRGRVRKRRSTSNDEHSTNFVTPRRTSPQKRKPPSLGRSRRNISSTTKQLPLTPREPGAKYEYDEALRRLRRLPIYEEEIKWALQETEPPYDLNEMVHLIRTKKKDDVEQSPEFLEVRARAEPFVGMRVRKMFDNKQYCGEVIYTHTVDSEKLWRVKYDEDGDEEDCNYNEVYNIRAHRPNYIELGRKLCALELFCGCATVSQAFSEQEWCVRSVDNDGKSNATDMVDIMKIQFKNIDFVPDFIWCSPPCETYSRLSGGTHRSSSSGEYAKTSKAIEHDGLFTQTIGILEFFKKKNPKLIVVIENPWGELENMPVMRQTEDYFPLYKAQVDYCRFQRDDKKPTHLWTNNKGLCEYLNQFKCNRQYCPFYPKNHPDSVRGRSSGNNYAAIPRLLAKEVAGWVNAEKMYRDGSRFDKEIKMSEADITEFNELGDLPTNSAEI